MQTFLPYPGFHESAYFLDRARLGKQRVEALQLLKALTVPGAGWSSHPAAKMWAGHINALVEYGVAICDEWRSRGYKDTCREKIRAFRLEGVPYAELPDWVGNPDFHSAHRSNLLRKDPVWYGTLGWKEPDNLPYVWPRGKE